MCLYYYLWWRDEIMIPLRQLRAIPDDPKFKPGWWDPLVHLDALASRRGERREVSPPVV